MIYPHVQYLGPAYPDRSKAERWAMRELHSRTTNETHPRVGANQRGTSTPDKTQPAVP